MRNSCERTLGLRTVILKEKKLFETICLNFQQKKKTKIHYRRKSNIYILPTSVHNFQNKFGCSFCPVQRLAIPSNTYFDFDNLADCHGLTLKPRSE